MRNAFERRVFIFLSKLIGPDPLKRPIIVTSFPLALSIFALIPEIIVTKVTGTKECN